MSIYDFPPKDWQDEPSETTPILSTDLERIEAGVAAGVRAASETQAGNVELASPAEMTTGTDLIRVPAVKRVVDFVNTQIAAAVASIPSASAATETAAGIVELASPTEMTTGTDLARVPAVKRVADYVTAAITASATTINASIAALSASVTTALTGKADKSGSWNQFADVSDVPFTDGDVGMFSGTTAAMEPTDMTLNFAGVDASLRLAPENWQQFFVPTVVIEEGSVPPGTFPSYGLVGKLPAAASLIPTILDVDSVRAANNVVLQIPSAMVAGEYIGFSLGWSNETPFDHFSAAFGGTGPGTGTFDFGTLSIPNTTAGVLNGFVKLSGPASAGSTITFTARDVSNNAINRVHLIAAIYSLPNLISSSPRDQQNVNGGASSATLTAATVALPGNTAQPSEILIGAACISAGSAPNTRDIAGTGPWSGGQIADHLSDNATNGRRLWVGYQILSAIGGGSLSTLVSLSGTATQTGQWATKIDALKGL